MSLKSALGDWLVSLIKHRLPELQSGTDRETSPHIDFRDPLASYEEVREKVAEDLRAAANAVGKDVMVGRCTLWGGRSDLVVGLRLGNSVRLYDGCRLVLDHASPESGIVLGDGVALNFNCYIEGSGGVTLGAGTILGPNVVIVSSGHGLEAADRNAKHYAPVRLGERVWVGANVVILAGVTIGDGSVIAAGSVVREDVPANAVAAGVPAKVVRTMEG